MIAPGNKQFVTYLTVNEKVRTTKMQEYIDKIQDQAMSLVEDNEFQLAVLTKEEKADLKIAKERLDISVRVEQLMGTTTDENVKHIVSGEFNI